MGVERSLVRNLAEALESMSPVGADGEWSFSDLGALLDVSEEDARLMVRLGVFGGAAKTRRGTSVPSEAVLGFLETHGEQWVLTRFRAAVETMRARCGARGP